MTEYALYLNVALIVLAAACACCLLAVLARSIREALEAVFRVFLRPALEVYRNARGFLETVRGWITGQLASESEREGDGPIYYLIGAVIYSVLTVVFLLSDFALIVLTAEAMGFEAADLSFLPDTSTLTAATLVTTAAFWGMILLDLIGVTRLAPWRKSLSTWLRRCFIGLSVFFLTLSVSVGLAMGIWRALTSVDFVASAGASQVEASYFELQGTAKTQEKASLQPQAKAIDDPTKLFRGIELKWLALFSIAGLAVLSMASSAFSMLGVVLLAKFLILLLVAVAVAGVLPVTFCAWLLCTILDAVHNAIRFLLEVPISLGNRVLGLFGWQPESAAVATPEAPAPRIVQPSAPPARAATPSAPADPGFNPFRRRPA